MAQGKGPDTKVREAMTPDVRYCFEDEDLGAVAMGEGPHPAGDALSGVSRPGGAHSQTGGERTGPGA